MTHAYWPLLDLRLRTGDLELAPLVEADLAEVVRLMPADLELNPTATRFAVDDRRHRGVVLHQEYWRSYGTWTTQAWRFHLAVRRDGELLGLQELEGNEFPTLRTVDTSSWLVESARGAGIGKAIRRAALALAFDHLCAQAAITSAWHDNHASLGVSRALGYQPNGVSRMEREGGRGVDVLTHLMLKRDDWLASGFGDDVEIEGFEPCRPLFGLPGSD